MIQIEGINSLNIMTFEDGHRVICEEHGSQGLSLTQYMDQMRNPDAFWKCPICRQVAQWDDEAYDQYCEVHDESDLGLDDIPF